MRDTATMVNGFDMSSVDALDPELRQIVKRRASLLGPAYKLFYANPVRIVRGEGVHLYDADGQAYLDAYNNVPSVGHTPLTAAELNLLPDLILGRVVARIIISEWRAERFPENRAYVLRNTPRAREHLHRLLSIPGEQTAARILEATRA